MICPDCCNLAVCGAGTGSRAVKGLAAQRAPVTRTVHGNLLYAEAGLSKVPRRANSARHSPQPTNRGPGRSPAPSAFRAWRDHAHPRGSPARRRYPGHLAAASADKHRSSGPQPPACPKTTAKPLVTSASPTDQDFAVAQTNLGLFYELGRGVPKDDLGAVRLYVRAADQGDATAQARLGYFYERGRGGLPKDDREAARLYRLAADQGNARAQARLGYFYEEGRGSVPKDDKEALRL